MVIRPIDKKLLIHNVKVFNQQDLVVTDINKVRVVIKNKISPVNSYQEEQVGIKAILFIDFVNSDYTSLDCLELGNIVEFDGARYNIEAIETMYGYEPHHIEVRLV